LQFVVLRRREIALGLNDEVVRGHPDLELALLGFELTLRELTCRLRGLHLLGGVLDVGCRVRDVSGHLQLDLANLRFDLRELNSGARNGCFLRALAERVGDRQAEVPGWVVPAEKRAQRVGVPARNRPDDLAVDAARSRLDEELRSALSDEAVPGRKIDLRK